LLLEVIDTGLGMDEETRNRCLEPFFSTKGQRGTGLGLAMVYGTMQRHQGSIEIESAPGKGTTMRLVFPLTEIDQAPAADRRPREPLAALHVLFIDDEPLLRELIREILEASGHTVTTADGGSEGIERFRELRRQGRIPDVVITDLGMPKVDGREVTLAVKRESPATPVIMMTGWGKMMRDQQEIRAPVDALISKPPQMAEIEETLRRVLPAASKPSPA
jgi:CheY-like chemotaxis protein